MKKFNFRLKQALKVRELKQKLAEKDVMVTNAQIIKNKKEQQRCAEAYADTFRFLSNQTSDQSFWQTVVSQYQHVLQNRQEDLSQQEVRLEKRRKDEMFLLKERMKDVKVMEKLREYQLEAHLKEVTKEEQTTMEELDLLKRGPSQ